MSTRTSHASHTSEAVNVHVYKHPTWDMELIIEASPSSRERALQNLADDATDADKSLLVCRQERMSRADFDSLPEFDG